jgi:multicomponent Na+:H+ antiporter subunit G
MTAIDIIGIVLIGIGVLFALAATIGLQRFPNVLMRMHAASKPQTVGLVLILSGAALIIGSWAIAGMLALVLAAQMITVTVASTLVGRAAFRRGFVSGGQYAVDQLTPRLAVTTEGGESGFVEEVEGKDVALAAEDSQDFPDNAIVVAGPETDLSLPSSWDEPEPEENEDESADDSLDIDLQDETETELEDVAERGVPVQDRRPKE